MFKKMRNLLRILLLLLYYRLIGCSTHTSRLSGRGRPAFFPPLRRSAPRSLGCWPSISGYLDQSFRVGSIHMFVPVPTAIFCPLDDILDLTLFSDILAPYFVPQCQTQYRPHPLISVHLMSCSVLVVSARVSAA